MGQLAMALEEPLKIELEVEKYSFIAEQFLLLIEDKLTSAKRNNDKLALRFFKLFKDGITLNTERNLANPICHTLRTAPAKSQAKFLEIDYIVDDEDIRRTLKLMSYNSIENKINYFGTLLKRFYIQVYTQCITNSIEVDLIGDLEISQFVDFIDTIVGEVLAQMADFMDCNPTRHFPDDYEC